MEAEPVPKSSQNTVFYQTVNEVQAESHSNNKLKYFSDEQIAKDVISKTHSMHGKDQESGQNFNQKNVKGKVQFEDVGVD